MRRKSPSEYLSPFDFQALSVFLLSSAQTTAVSRRPSNEIVKKNLQFFFRFHRGPTHFFLHVVSPPPPTPPPHAAASALAWGLATLLQMHSASAVYALSAMAQTAVALGYGSSEESAILPPVVCALQWYLQADAWDPAAARRQRPRTRSYPGSRP